MRPITEVLDEFPRELAGEAPTMPADFDVGSELALDLPEPADDTAARDAAARSALIAEVHAAAQAQCAERLDALTFGHAAELAAARAGWAAEEGAVLAAALTEGLARVETAIAASLAGALLPVLGDAVRARAAGELAEAVRRLLAGGDGEVIEVRGAADLLAPVRLAFDGHPGVSVIEADLPGVSVSAGQALVASRIETWRERLHGALEMTP